MGAMGCRRSGLSEQQIKLLTEGEETDTPGHAMYHDYKETFKLYQK